MSNFTTADERTAVQSVRPARLAGLHYHSGPPGLIEDLMEMWRYRDVLWMLVVRDIKVRYRQAVIGAAWAVIQPALATLVFLWLFTRIRNEGVIDHAYPVSAYLGLICWQWFANSAREGTQVLVANRNLITKVYFPRLLLPLSPVLSAGVDFLVATAMLPALYYWYAAKIDLGSF